MFTNGTGMVFFDVALAFLAAVASVSNLAVYRSKSIDGSPVADHVRAIKAAAWGVLFLFLCAMLYEYGDAPLTGICLVVFWLLSVSDIVAALARIGARLEVERMEARHRPATVAHPHR